ncbi:SGNH/GDSL hydrolase family protein [Lutibacter sp. A64]|uniref:SGNH/GDSL hydrolase family protein n=1 Tax=Lutibacter sp. A64 TaxID=2918526 RepID=UPI001F0622CE|nr:SGNH/GDSL hydrolase family protein [Lutibacter sp. A64]UMB54979.1 SGNH/GDSL hydrolase family protein [Lutibacter sp. A64]
MKIKTIQLTLCILFMCSSIEFLYAQDWANLERFKKENAELLNLKKDENSVVFMGNSITEGWLRIRPEFFSKNPYINRGISGQTTPQMLLRFRQDVIDLKPGAVVILAGINDIAGNTGPSTIEMIVGNIISMTELAKANNIKVILCSVLPAYDFPWRKGLEPAEKVVKLNTLLKAYAKQQNIEFVDYFTPMANKLNGLKVTLGDDGVHPNLNGYLIMEPLVKKAIAKTLSLK